MSLFLVKLNMEYFYKCLLPILNCRSLSKLTLNWGHELLQAPGEFFSQTQKKSILKMQKLCNGTKDSWDLFELDRVWNWCYLNKGKMFSSSSSKWIYIYSSRCCIYKFQTKFNTLSFRRKSQTLVFYSGLFENEIYRNKFYQLYQPWSDSPVQGK